MPLPSSYATLITSDVDQHFLKGEVSQIPALDVMGTLLSGQNLLFKTIFRYLRPAPLVFIPYIFHAQLDDMELISILKVY